MISKQVTIILPCYHVCDYIPNIVSDLKEQTYWDFKAIFVNDGDHSQDSILEKIVTEDSRFQVVWKENEGLSSARNAGLKIIDTEWVVFVDPDDRIGPHYVEKLVNGVRDCDVEVGVAGYEIVTPRENIHQVMSVENPGIFEVHNAFAQYLWEPFLLKTVWNKIYRVSLFNRLNLTFDIDIQRPEDWIFNLHVYHNISKVVLIDNCEYKYYLNDAESLCSSYLETFEKGELRAIELELALINKLKLSKSFIEERTYLLYGLYAYFMVCNLFKRKSTLSLLDARKRISEELFARKDIIDYYYKWKDNRKNLFLKMFYFALKTKSPFFMALFFKSQYWIKYNFMSFYLFVKPFLRK